MAASKGMDRFQRAAIVTNCGLFRTWFSSHGQSKWIKSLKAMPSYYLFSPQLPSFVMAFRSPNHMAQFMLSDEREPQHWIADTFVIGPEQLRGFVDYDSKGFIVDWGEETVPPEELREILTKRLSVIGWRRDQFAPSVALVCNFDDFERVYRQFPDRGERAGWIRGCLYAGFVAFVVLVVVLWKFRAILKAFQ